MSGDATAAKPRRANGTLGARARGAKRARGDALEPAMERAAHARAAVLVPASREARHSPTSAPRDSDTARLAAAAAKRRCIVAIVRGSTRARESTGRFGTYTARLVNARGEVSIRRNALPGGGRERL